MNTENVNKLIEETEAFPMFNFRSCNTCLLRTAGLAQGLPYAITSVELGEFLGLPYTAAYELAFAGVVGDQEWDKINKAHALRTLEHLKATGMVDWTATKTA